MAFEGSSIVGREPGPSQSAAFNRDFQAAGDQRRAGRHRNQLSR